MKKLPQISEAELEVMKIIWKEAPINTNEVTEKLCSASNWNPRTVHTFLKRLVDKKVITYEKKGRLFVYKSLVNENEYLQQENHSFLKRFYNGNISTMMTSFIDNNTLTQDEINELKELLNQHTTKDVD